jgi:cytoskeleton-associated protein 5
MSLDEVLIAGKGTYDLEEDLLTDEIQDPPSGPLEDRLDSKVWKTRAQAYEELADMITSGTEIERWAGMIAKWVGDAHPGAQESALQLAVRVVREKPSVMQGETAIETAKTAVEKGLASTKASIKAAASELIIGIFEALEDGWEPFTLAISALLEQKNVKVQSAGLSAFTLLLSSFGPSDLPLKQWLPAVERLCSSPNPTVRSDSLRFLREAFRWLSDSLPPLLPHLKKDQLEELRLVAASPVPTPSKSTKKVHTRSLIDAFDQCDAKDIFTRFNEAWCDQVLNMEKWTDRKEALELLNTEADVGKLVERPAEALVALGKRLLNDANIQVVVQVIRMLGLLAKGQRGAFEQPAKHFLPLLVAKFRDKKPQIVSETHQSLLRFLKSLKYSYLLEKLPKLLEDKTPSVRINLFAYLEALITAEPEQTQAASGAIADLVKRHVADNVAEIRDAAINTLVEYLTKTDAGAVMAAIKDLPAAKVKKIQDLAAERSRKEAASPIIERKSARSTTLPSARRGDKPPIHRNPVEEEAKMPLEVSPTRKPARISTLIPRSRTRIDLNTSQDSAPGSMSPAVKRGKRVDPVIKVSVEELRDDFVEKLKEQCKGRFAPDLLGNMFHKDFKKVLDAANGLGEVVRRENGLDTAELAAKWIYVRLFDTNTQVLKAVLEAASALFTAYSAANAQLQDTVSSVLMPILCERMGHNNTTIRTQAREVTQQSYAVQVPSRYVAYLCQGLASKNTRTRVECLEALNTAVRDLAAPPPSCKDIKTAAKLAAHSDISLKNATLSLFSELNSRFPEVITEALADFSDRKAKDLLEQRLGPHPRSKSRTPEARSLSPMKSESPFKPLPTDRVLEVHHEAATPRFEASARMENIPEPEFHFPTNETLLYEDTGKLEFEQDSSLLDRNIQVLRTGDMSSRVDALVAVNDLLMNGLEKHRADIQHRASYLIEAMCVVLTSTFDRPVPDIPLRFAKYFLNVLQKVCSTTAVMREITENASLTLVSQLLSKLLQEDLGKVGEKGEGEQLLKVLNATMVKVLEHSDPTQIITVLFRLLCLWRKDTLRNKHLALAIKCLLKLEKVLSALSRSIDSRILLLKAHEFLLSAASEPEDSSAMKAVKGIIVGLGKALGPAIWQAYEAVRRHPQADTTLERWLKGAQDGLEYVDFERIKADPLADIFLKLHASETYDDGLRELLDYRFSHPGADLSPHLKTCSHALFDRITDDLRSAAAQESDQESSFKISEFQTRLSSMKKRYGLASSNVSEHLTTTLTELKNKVNLLLSTARPESTALASDTRMRLDALRK